MYKLLIVLLFVSANVSAGSCTSYSDYKQVVDEFTDEVSIDHKYNYTKLTTDGFLSTSGIYFRHNVNKDMYAEVNLRPIFGVDNASLHTIMPKRINDAPKFISVMFRIDSGKVRTFDIPLEGVRGSSSIVWSLVYRNTADIKEFMSYINTAKSKIAIRVNGLVDHVITLPTHSLSSCKVSFEAPWFSL